VTNKLHHVNVNVPPGRSDAVATIYCEVFGFERIARPDNGREGVWLEVGDGTQLHLSERDQPGHPQQHFALMVDDLEAVTERLDAAGAAFERAEDVFDTGGRGFTRDPAGNRIEVVAAGGG